MAAKIFDHKLFCVVSKTATQASTSIEPVGERSGGSDLKMIGDFTPVVTV